MKLTLRNNHCQGWWQGVAFNDDGSEHSASLQFPGPEGRNQATEAVYFFHKNGKWPREVEDQEVEFCEHCGKAIS